MLRFSTFDVTGQVFYRSRLSFGLVNISPLTKGHVLLVPKRCVPRLADLTNDEVYDLFSSAQTVLKRLESHLGALAVNLAVQDGKHAGQSVPHVHVHLIPRRALDFGGETDRVYDELEQAEGSLKDEHEAQLRVESLKIDDSARRRRSAEEMAEEANEFAALFPDHQQ
ncbi:uncharacterized protein L969DRAFT_96195 [Mixia osmundae IAM 14324]|uniref:HIT domain-containing protein n=1 Tax=Mixia osmundae (strain CBS 9802 / IAM 14324 / JCM 22182 / KY 12970) TaxID=764103 RepID=G7E4P8_MIXOS|nr:uncharacterized protein L969DRAFT_96195 [Mixia osmundae IAM 14324]KEI37674.1 hypothetical protein L969DRAFT_96195 [Mixia osmundae IAM 14324]GAA97808.1 hypothetical protein E5Q_04487 [Mixia osmundae IAM 14324]